MKIEMINRINPVSQNSIVINLKDIFEKLKYQYHFDFNLSRKKNPRVPSLIFDDKAAEDSDIIKALKDIFIAEIKNRSNSDTTDIVLCWNTTYDITDQNGSIYEDVSPETVTNFIKLDSKTVLQSLSVTQPTEKTIQSNLAEMSGIALSGTYTSAVISVHQHAVLSYSSNQTRPVLSAAYPKKRYAFNLITEYDDVEVPLFGFVNTVASNKKYDTPLFKESCTVFVFEMFKHYDKELILSDMTKDEVRGMYFDFINNKNGEGQCKDILQDTADEVFRLKSQGFDSIYNAVSQVKCLYSFLYDSHIDPKACICTRADIFVNDIKKMICQHQLMNVSTTLRDKVNPYDILLLPEKVYRACVHSDIDTYAVQTRIADNMVQNKILRRYGDKILLNTETDIVCLPVSLKERSALFGKGTSYFSPISRRLPDCIAQGYNVNIDECWFDKSFLTRGDESLKIIEQHKDVMKYTLLLDKLGKSYSETLVKYVCIYGYNSAKKDMPYYHDLTEADKIRLAQLFEDYEGAHINFKGIEYYRGHLMNCDKNDECRFVRYNVRQQDYIDYIESQSNPEKYKADMISCKQEVLLHKLRALSYAAVIREFNDNTLKQLINYMFGKLFGQVYILIQGNIYRNTIYSGKLVIENEDFVGADSRYISEHILKCENIKTADDWGSDKYFELRDKQHKKEVSIYNLPFVINGFEDKRLYFTFHTSTSNAQISLGMLKK